MTAGLSIREELSNFFEKIWGKHEGVVKLAFRENALKDSFSPYIYAWPDTENIIVPRVEKAIAANQDVFYSPDMYSDQARITRKTPKDFILGSQWLFIDFDGDAPELEWYQLHDVPMPSMIVQSSTVDRQHVYWQLEEFNTNIQEIEAARRGLIARLGGDPSGWDAGQFLRVPFSVNHKYGKERTPTDYPVTIELESNSIYKLNIFPTSKPVEVITSAINLESLPSIHHVLTRNTFSDDFLTEFFETVEERKARGGDRSGGYARITHLCIESGLSEQDTFVVLCDLDTRWGKYLHRNDRHRIFLRTIAQIKALPQHSSNTGNVELGIKTRYTLGELLDSELEIEWVFEDLLSTEGHGIIFGPPSVGKTTLSLRLAIACATGGDFLGWKNSKGRPLRTLFYSLEMYAAGIKKFLKNMSDIEVKRTEVKDNLLLDIINENIRLEDPKARKFIVDRIKDDNPDIIIIDSMSQMVTQSLINDDATRSLNMFVRELRKVVGCGVIIVHHDKKSQERKSQGHLDDMYGGRNLQQDVDFIMSMYPTKDATIIRACLAKSRFCPAGTEYYIQRTEGSTFEIVDPPADTKEGSGMMEEAIQNLYKGTKVATDPPSRRDDSPRFSEEGFKFSNGSN